MTTNLDQPTTEIATIPPKQPGRPLVLTPSVKATILAKLAEGNFLNVACRAAGIDRGSFYRWKRRVESDELADREHGGFFNTVKKALADGEMAAIRVVRSGVRGWESSAWFLERRHPERWGRWSRGGD